MGLKTKKQRDREFQDLLKKLKEKKRKQQGKAIAACLPKIKRDRAIDDNPTQDNGQGVLLYYPEQIALEDIPGYNQNLFSPQPIQEKFLQDDSDIVLFGGAAGGGKTVSLLMQPLIHIHDPSFSALFLRRTFAEIDKPGGLLDESGSIYPSFDANLDKGNYQWTFPSEAKVKFDHLQYEMTVHKYQGSQVPLICFDELSHFTWKQFSYLMSRNRSARSTVKPYIRASTNPDPDSFLLEFVDYYLDSEGYPDPSKAGQQRYFVNDKGTIVWNNDYQELERKYKSSGLFPRSFAFHPAKLSDNRILEENDPTYKANLLSMGEVEQEQLLKGNWYIRDEAGKVFNENWFELIEPESVPSHGRLVRGWDLAASEKKVSGQEPSATASILIKEVRDRARTTYYVLEATEDYLSPVDGDNRIRELAYQDVRLPNSNGYSVRWEQEGGSSGKRDAQHLTTLLQGFDARGIKPEGDKVVRAKPFAAAAYNGQVKLVKAPWNNLFLKRYHSFPDSDKKDLVDAGSIAFRALSTGRKQKIVSRNKWQ